MTYHIKLNKYETVFYFFGFGGGVFYSFYRLYLAGSFFDNFVDTHGDFSPGWSWIGRKKDVSDYEWETWVPAMIQLIPWITAHLLIAQFLKFIKFNSTVICCWYILTTISFLYYSIGFDAVVLMLIQPTISCLLISIRSIPLAYYVQIGMLIAVQVTAGPNLFIFELIKLDEKKQYITVITIFWVQLRCISCTIDSINNYKHKNVTGFLKNLVEITAYCLYLPTLMMGPFFLFSEFIKGINSNFNAWTWRKIAWFIFNLLRFIFWAIFTEVFLHFVYCNAWRFQFKAVNKLDSWAFYGLGYGMGQFFCNKYIVVYGIGGVICRADDINAPPPPKCIGRIHLYSEMWKHFDRGLHQFLVRYIYGPITKYKIPFSRIIGAFLTFGFVYLWHGLHKFVFMWSLLNFLGIVIEDTSKSIGRTSTYTYWQNRILSPRNVRRFHCFLGSFLLSLSAVSNFYFFSGMKLGNLYMYRLFQDSLIVIITRTFLIYCCCQVSTEMKQLESSKKTERIEF